MIGNEERYPDPEEAQRRLFAASIVGVWTCTVGAIVSFDPVKVTAQVQVGIKGQQLKPDGSIVPFAIKMLQDVPVIFPGGGGARLTFPLKQGDECLIVFGCRAIDAWWQSGGIQLPSDSRTHDLSDAIAFVGPQSQAHKISGISATKVQLRSDDGSTLVELDPIVQTINFVAPGGMTFTTPTAHFTGDVSIDGDTTGEGINLHDHVHSGVQSGSGNSGPPV